MLPPMVLEPPSNSGRILQVTALRTGLDVSEDAGGSFLHELQLSDRFVLIKPVKTLKNKHNSFQFFLFLV